MKLDSFLGDSQFCADLFIEHSRNDTCHHFALKRRKRFVMRTQMRELCLQLAPDCLLDGVEQILLAERFGEKLDRAGFHDTRDGIAGAIDVIDDVRQTRSASVPAGRGLVVRVMPSSVAILVD
jgi:hypothetical protein